MRRLINLKKNTMCDMCGIPLEGALSYCEWECKNCKNMMAFVNYDYDHMKEKSKNILQKLWEDMQNDASDTAKEYMNGHIDAFYRLNFITTDEQELWERRMDDCPAGGPEGHAEDDPCRVWCAYCGNLVCGICNGEKFVSVPDTSDDFPTVRCECSIGEEE